MRPIIHITVVSLFLSLSIGCAENQRSGPRLPIQVLSAERTVLRGVDQMQIDHEFFPSVIAAPTEIVSVQRSCTCVGISVKKGDAVTKVGNTPITLSMSLAGSVARSSSNATVFFDNGQAVSMRLNVHIKGRLRIEKLSFPKLVDANATFVPISCNIVTVSRGSEEDPKPTLMLENGDAFRLDLVSHHKIHPDYHERTYHASAGLTFPAELSRMQSAVRAQFPKGEINSANCYQALVVERVPEVSFDTNSVLIRARDQPAQLTASKSSGPRECQFEVSNKDFKVEIVSLNDDVARVNVFVNNDIGNGVHLCDLTVLSNGRCVGTKKLVAIFD